MILVVLNSICVVISWDHWWSNQREDKLQNFACPFWTCFKCLRLSTMTNDLFPINWLHSVLLPFRVKSLRKKTLSNRERAQRVNKLFWKIYKKRMNDLRLKDRGENSRQLSQDSFTSNTHYIGRNLRQLSHNTLSFYNISLQLKA